MIYWYYVAIVNRMFMAQLPTPPINRDSKQWPFFVGWRCQTSSSSNFPKVCLHDLQSAMIARWWRCSRELSMMDTPRSYSQGCSDLWPTDWEKSKLSGFFSYLVRHIVSPCIWGCWEKASQAQLASPPLVQVLICHFAGGTRRWVMRFQLVAVLLSEPYLQQAVKPMWWGHFGRFLSTSSDTYVLFSGHQVGVGSFTNSQPEGTTSGEVRVSRNEIVSSWGLWHCWVPWF